MTESALSLQLNKFIKYGYRYAYSYKQGGTLESALTFKMITTSKQLAKEMAERIHIAVGSDIIREVNVWDLKEELAQCSKGY